MTQSVDLYAMGIVMHEMIAMQPMRQSRGALQLLSDDICRPADPLREHVSQVRHRSGVAAIGADPVPAARLLRVIERPARVFVDHAQVMRRVCAPEIGGTVR